MADPYVYTVSTGTITVDASVIQAQVIAEYQGLFGADLIVTPDTPQGMLITAETLARTAAAENNAAIANQINPMLAGGVYLDALLALTGTFREPALYSLVTAVITGTPGTFIPEGSLAQETVSNNLFASSQNVTIGITGSATVIFVATVTGAVPAAPNTLTRIISGVLGWLTIDNPAAATLGQMQQSDIAARQFRVQTLFAQGTNLAGAIIASVSAVENVNSMTFLENFTGAPLTVSGVTLPANSIYACISGGVQLDVATAYIMKKSGGCAMYNGASSHPVTQNVTNPYSSQVIPVKFDRPDMISIVCQVTAGQGTSPVTNLTAAIQNVVFQWGQGYPGVPLNLTVGASVSSFEIAAALIAALPGIYVANVQVSLASPISLVSLLPIDVWQQAFFASLSAIVVEPA